MGLTLYYELGSSTEPIDAIAAAVSELHRKAASLPFEWTTPLDFSSEEQTRQLKQRADLHGGDVEARILLGEASCGAKNDGLDELLGDHHYTRVEPECFYRFTVYPGEGSETATFGLSRMPHMIRVDGREWETGLSRWHWHSFCKTQYASNPAHGGVDHFLTCHLALIELLDFAAELGILIRVGDDGGYWENRDEQALRENLEAMNRTVAAFTGKMKDAFGDDRGAFRAPITDFPDFEHLEAEGAPTDRDADPQ